MSTARHSPKVLLSHAFPSGSGWAVLDGDPLCFELLANRVGGRKITTVPRCTTLRKARFDGSRVLPDIERRNHVQHPVYRRESGTCAIERCPVLAAAVGMMLAAVWLIVEPELRSATWLRTTVLVVGAFLALSRWSISPIQVLAVAALVGALWTSGETT